MGQPIVDGTGMTTDGTKLFSADAVQGRVHSLNPDGSSLTQLGSRFGGFFNTERYHLITFSSGTLFISDGGCNDPRRGCVAPSEVVSHPAGAGSFTNLHVGAPLVYPRGVAVLNGSLFVSDPGAGNTIWTLPTTGGTPTALVSGAPFGEILEITSFNNALYVADFGDGAPGKIYKISLEGSEGVEKVITSGPQSVVVPDTITFETQNTSCTRFFGGPGDTFEFLLNGTSLGTVPADPTNSCSCNAPIDTFAVTDASLIATAWNSGGSNDFRFVKTGTTNAFAWTRAEVQAGAQSGPVCISDINGGDCTVTNLCKAGYTFDQVDQTTTIPDPFEGEIDVVVEVGQTSTTEYAFDITYSNPDGPAVLIVDTVPAEWVVTEIEGVNDDVEACGESDRVNGGFGSVEVFKGGKVGKKCKSATHIEWTPDPNGGTINVLATTRQSPGKKNVKFAPTSCGTLFLNDGASVFELDPETGELIRDSDTGELLPPLFESNNLCLAAVKDVNGDGKITRDGTGDEDGDGLSDLTEACEILTNPCLVDTDTPGDFIKVTGGGFILDGTVKHSFGFNIHYDDNGNATMKGQLQFVAHDGNMKYHGNGVSTVVVTGNKAEFTGLGLLNGKEGYSYTVKVMDNGNPGRGKDTFSIQITSNSFTYEYSGNLAGGNITVHEGKPEVENAKVGVAVAKAKTEAKKGKGKKK